MRRNPFLTVMAAMALSAMPGGIEAAEMSAAQDTVQQQMGRDGNPIGVPEPGSISDQESTQKHRNPAREQRTDQNTQVTLGGAQSTVTGELLTIDGAYYFVKDEESGGEVRLLVNSDTRLICGTSQDASITKRQGTQDAAGSERQIDQGQKKDETAMGSGFEIGPQGGCIFKPGDKIRAEVSDLGTVTTMKSVSEQKRSSMTGARSVGETAGTGELAIPKQDKPGQLDMTGGQSFPPKQYVILPVPYGEFKGTSEDSRLPSAVKSQDGKPLGTVKNLIMDSNTRQIEYAEVLLKDTGHLAAVPWAQFKIGEDPHVLVLNTAQYQLEPSISNPPATDRSPRLEQVMPNREHLVAPADIRGEERRDERAASTPGKDSKDVKGEIVRGQVLTIDGDSMFVKVRGGKEVHLNVDQHTHKGQVNLKDESFKVGDKIEAYVTPDGHAFSISLMRQQSNMPGDPEGGG